MKILKFEELESWQQARLLVNMVYKLTGQGNFARDFKLRDQIQATAVSGMSNIAEGFDRRSNKEFIRFLNIAFSSLTEVQSQLYVAIDQGYINTKEFQATYEQAVKAKQLIAGFTRYLATKKKATKKQGEHK